jgi:hypothetical protein
MDRRDLNIMMLTSWILGIITGGLAVFLLMKYVFEG